MPRWWFWMSPPLGWTPTHVAQSGTCSWSIAQVMATAHHLCSRWGWMCVIYSLTPGILQLSVVTATTTLRCGIITGLGSLSSRWSLLRFFLPKYKQGITDEAAYFPKCSRKFSQPKTLLPGTMGAALSKIPPWQRDPNYLRKPGVRVRSLYSVLWMEITQRDAPSSVLAPETRCTDPDKTASRTTIKVTVWFKPVLYLPSWNPHYHFILRTSLSSMKECKCECVCVCVLCRNDKCST